ncbi:MAG: hypothetical protein EOP04_10605 [Proteobacteria bacterium]|nr:MAG: hypothetical protein EOP04_10605 [Pseudomonadota bacterium]
MKKLNGNTIFALLFFLGSAPVFAAGGPPGCYTITECTQVCDSKGTCTQRCTKQTICNADQLPPEIEVGPKSGPDLGTQPLINPIKFETEESTPVKELDWKITAGTPIESRNVITSPTKLHPGATITTIE